MRSNSANLSPKCCLENKPTERLLDRLVRVRRAVFRTRKARVRASCLVLPGTRLVRARELWMHRP